MIVITGGAGFIGSCLVWALNEQTDESVVVIDELGLKDKWKNLSKRQLENIIAPQHAAHWMEKHAKTIRFVFHMGACSNTTESDADYLIENNVHESMRIFNLCAQHDIPLIYASSAATYGAGHDGYSDKDEFTPKLRPINKYGYSKQFFDAWVLTQKNKPPFWAGLRFFNVYGPNEYHKGSQASVVFHAFPQIKDQQSLRLFKSYREGIAHGEQKRDFVYVKDVIKVMLHFYNTWKKNNSGIYNVGSGKARSFIDLGSAVFSALKIDHVQFDWIEMPDLLREQYQYFTEADLSKLCKQGGYTDSFTSLEDGICDYVQTYLVKKDSYL